MPFSLPPLPYAKSALAPTISERTLEFHYEKHHRAYVDKLNKLTASTPLERLPLEDVIMRAWGHPDSTKIFNNAAQVWNHTFFWNSMTARGGERGLGSFRARIDNDFGSYAKFEDAFVHEAVEQFGTGYVWLILEEDRLKVVTTDDAVPPTVLRLQPLLTCDLWEHAYYLDYQNDREGFVRGFLKHLANWQFAERQIGVTHPRPAISATATA